MTVTRPRRLIGAVGAAALAIGMTAVAVTGTAGAKTNSSPSDPRATYVTGNAVTCAQAGVTADAMAFASGTGSIDDGNVSGSVTGGTNVNVDDPAPGVTIVAIVVKGGPAYNVYSDADVLPPTLSSPQNYISPLNGGGNVPTVSHWFICYDAENPPPPPTPGTGSLVIQKVAAGDLTNPVAAGTVTIAYQCDDAADTHGTVTLPGTGGSSDPITDIDEGTTCLVQETTALPGVTPTYVPVNPEDATEGIAIIGADSTVTVAVTNDYPSVGGEVVTPTPPVQVAAAVVVAPGFTG